MKKPQFRLFPLGDSALTVEFGDSISESLNGRAINAAKIIADTGFPGLIETVPAYASATIFYDPLIVRRAFSDFPTSHDAVSSLVTQLISDQVDNKVAETDPIDIEIEFGGDAGPDLEYVAEHNSLSSEKVISIFLSKIYRVYMLGFLPGFTYMGELDRRIETPRKASPRTRVEPGSVGIADRQTGIYSLASPGGWQIIGHTDAKLFSPDLESPSLFSPGDRVRFVVKK